MPTVDLITEYVIRYGFQVLGAILVFAVGALVARWAENLPSNGSSVTTWSHRFACCWQKPFRC